MARLFEVVRLTPIVDADALAVARDWAEHNELEVDDETLAEALDLASHYLPATAPPGTCSACSSSSATGSRAALAAAVTPETVLSTLSDATGLPLHVLDPRAPLTSSACERSSRRASSASRRRSTCLVDRIALVKAGLTDPTRPLGVFLFVGPTGTGKTEIAKAFAEFLFGSADRLVRLDMSEYQTPESLERLLGDAASRAAGRAADRAGPQAAVLGACCSTSSRRRTRSVWDIFLQVFDDGRLTDRSGRTVDFRHCVIILTSNLGSAIPTGPGSASSARPAAFDAASVAQVGRRSRSGREFLNRLDRVVVFRPLGRASCASCSRRSSTDVLRGAASACSPGRSSGTRPRSTSCSTRASAPSSARGR